MTKTAQIKMGECKPLPGASCDRPSTRAAILDVKPRARGLHSFPFQLNLSTLCGIGGALRGCLGGDRGY